MLELRTLGTLDLRSRDGLALDSLLAQPKRTALLLTLVLARPHGLQQRDTLLALFWPERDTERARTALRQALYFLRTELGDSLLVARRACTEATAAAFGSHGRVCPGFPGGQ